MKNQLKNQPGMRTFCLVVLASATLAGCSTWASSPVPSKGYRDVTNASVVLNLSYEAHAADFGGAAFEVSPGSANTHWGSVLYENSTGAYVPVNLVVVAFNESVNVLESVLEQRHPTGWLVAPVPASKGGFDVVGLPNGTRSVLVFVDAPPKDKVVFDVDSGVCWGVTPVDPSGTLPYASCKNMTFAVGRVRVMDAPTT